MDDTELAAIVRAELRDAAAFVDDELASDREESTKYYRGDPLGNEEDGRSQVISRDVRDAVQQILPSLMRVFFGSDRPVEYVPRNADDAPLAEQATDYANYVLLQDNPGFEVFYAVFKDALIRKAGIVKWLHDDAKEVTYHRLTGLDDAALGALLSEPGVELVGASSTPDPQVAGQAVAMGVPIEAVPAIHDVEVRRVRKSGRIRVCAVPPEEFLVSRSARTVDDANVVAHRRLCRFTDLVAMGYDPDELESHVSHMDAITSSGEAMARTPWSNWPDVSNNPALRPILYTEAYIRVDYDGDGIAELRKVCAIGDDYVVVRNEPCGEVPMAAFCPDPEPHTFFGHDVADQTKDVQRIKTALMRGALDSLAQSLYPRTAVVEGQVNIEDVLNTETGAIIRQNAPGMVQPFTTPFVGDPAFRFLEYMDDVKAQRVGIHNMALEADALQSTTKAAVNAQVDAARQHIELIARIFAENGMKRVFRGLLRLMTTHQDKARMVRLRNEWVEVDPRVWDATMDVSVNVGLGYGTNEDRTMALREVLGIQREILTTLGPANPMVGYGHLRNTLGKLLESAGYKDTTQFFKPVDLNFEPPPPEPRPDPAEILAQAEMTKAQSGAQADAAKLDLERDKLNADIVMKAKELELKYKTAIDVAALRKGVA